MKKTTLKLILIAFVICLTFTAVTAGSLALFTDSGGSSDSAASGGVDIVLDEDFAEQFYEEHPDYGSYTGMKVFRVISRGSEGTYVRARFFITAEYKNNGGEWVTIGSVSSDDFSYSLNAPLWSDGGDGWWYYSKILRQAGEGGPAITEDFFIYDISLNKPLPGLEDKPVRINVTVRAEGSRAVQGAFDKIFGVSAMPEGTEPAEQAD